MKTDCEVTAMIEDLTRLLSDIGHPIPAWFSDKQKIKSNGPLSNSEKSEMLDILIASYRNSYAVSFSRECAEKFGHHAGEAVFVLNGHGICASVSFVAAFLQFQVESVIFSERGSNEDVYRFYAANASSDQPEFIVDTIRAGFAEICAQISSGDPLTLPAIH